MFNPNETAESLIQWIRDWFEVNGKGCNAIIGMSGGKDSTIVAALCVKALGKDRVIGVAMPDGEQGLNGANEICDYLGIKMLHMPITAVTRAMGRPWHDDMQWSKQTEQNIPPRCRMMMLYAVAQTMNGRVMGTCNLSENYLGYFTKHGDGASDVEPIGKLTVTELLAIGDSMGLPYEWVHKTPDDGLPHSSSDEEKLGFTYAVLDKYIRGTEMPDDETKKKIDGWHERNLFKMKPVAMFEPVV